MRYVLNGSVFRRRLVEMGYSGLLDFSRKTMIHRNTINNYLSGKQVFSSAFAEIAKELGVSPLDIISPISETKAGIEGVDELRPVLAKMVGYDNKIAVVLLGSRAKGRSKKYSDWDLGITRGEVAVEASEYLRIKQIVEDETDDIPRGVDVVNLDAAPLWFLKGIDYQPIFLDGNYESFLYFKGVLNGIKKG